MMYKFNIQTGLKQIVLVLCVFMTTGCGDPASDSTGRYTAKTVKESALLVKAARQSISLTEPEARLAAGGDNKRLARQVVDRIEKQADSSAIDQAMADITKTLEQIKENQNPPDNQQLLEVTQQLISTSQAFLNRQEAIDLYLQSENEKRLQNAEKKLRDALQMAKQQGNNTAQIGPELMLGTVKLSIARNRHGRIRSMERNVISERIALAGAVNGIATEMAFESGIQNYLPDKTIAAVDARLEGAADQTGETAPLKQQLVEVEQHITDLNQQLNTLNEQIDSHRRQAEQLHQQYQQLMEQAKISSGAESYELQRQAYDIQAGYRTDTTQFDGIIDHESQIELDTSAAATIQDTLNYYQLRQQQIKRTIAQINTTVEQLKNSPVIERVQKGRQASQSRLQPWVADVMQRLNAIEKQEEQYGNTRLEIVEAYKEARAAYERAAGLARGNQKAQKYAQTMADIAAVEQAAFWLEDADHFHANAESMAMIEHLRDINTRAGVLRSNYLQQQQDALNAAEQLTGEMNPGSKN